MPMYRFLLRPKWLLLHALIAALVVLMVNLAFWQLRRLDERKAFNSLVNRNSQEAVAPFSSVVTDGVDASTIEWRPVSISGEYRPDLAVTIVNRAQNGTAGVDSVVPVEIAPGSYVLVNRGFVPLSIGVPAPPQGKVTVTGYLRQSQRRGFGGSIDSSTGVITELHRIDVPRIDQQIDGNVAAMYVQRVESAPSEGEWPALVAAPKLDEGPHLSYAVQWFFFSACALGGWVLVVRKRITQDRDSSTSATESA